jgi:hypothetical protein
MIATTRAPLAARTGLLLLCLSCLILMPAALAAGAEGSVSYDHESLAEYEQQLNAGQIQAVTINKKVRSVHVTLKDGRHVLAKYAAHEEPKVAEVLEAKKIPVTVLSKAAADKEANKAVHHKLRYIAAGVLLLVVIVVGGVLLADRRRKAQRD